MAETSWCDKLAATPLVGFTFESPFYAPSDLAMSALSPILNAKAELGPPTFTVEAYEPFNVTINTEEGWRYALDHSKVTVMFNHRIRAKAVSGGAPIMEMLSQPAPFTELLPSAMEKLIDITSRLPSASQRALARVGIVAVTQVAREDLPPGIQDLIRFFGSAWNTDPEELNMNVTIPLDSNSNWRDRCVHQIGMAEDRSSLISINIDFQRIYNNPKSLNAVHLRTVTRETSIAALQYYENVADGSAFSENLLGALASK